VRPSSLQDEADTVGLLTALMATQLTQMAGRGASDSTTVAAPGGESLLALLTLIEATVSSRAPGSVRPPLSQPAPAGGGDHGASADGGVRASLSRS